MLWPRSSWIRRVLRLAPLWVLVIPACDFHGCGGSAEKKSSAPRSDAGTSRVEMVRAGSEPRVSLSVARWTGLRYQLELTSTGTFGVQGRPPVNAPTAVADLSFTVVRGMVDPVVRDGRRLVKEQAVLRSLRVKGGGLPPAVVAKMNQALSATDGTTLRQLVAGNGEVVEMKTELVGGAKPSPQVRKTLDQAWDAQRHFPFRLPPVPVGVGASWRFSEPTEVRGVRTLQIADMTIIGMDAKKVRISLRVHQQAPRQELENPLDPDSTAILEHYRGDGQGELTIDRMTAVTLQARLAVTASLELSAIDAQGHKQRVRFIAATVVKARGWIGAPDGGTTAAAARAGEDGSAAAAATGGAAKASGGSGPGR